MARQVWGRAIHYYYCQLLYYEIQTKQETSQPTHLCRSTLLSLIKQIV